ncbi:ABC transporter ATP-binding protein [Neopusillimonas maritima]|uniref:ABC transporter ATP-binding protein n=1 Tax=Neopusillimonas maritima TaxID=2026239 RepID=A0A3A1YQT5_9BURK|nr:ABC transporter ATP-binding protein [Neopusillimonas maritima]RIY39599.1 ABC transporter ATP-binding protein [Neopusillimonas maritima]
MKSILTTERLTKKYGALVVTDNISIDIKQGEIHAIIGPNGAGKTTLINQLSGELKPQEGEVYFNGNNVTALSISKRARAGLVRSYQITSVFDELSVLENVVFSALASRKHAYRFWGSLLSYKQEVASALSALELTGLAAQMKLPAHQLGYGQRRQLELAMALATNPKFLLLDEPMAGMSVQESNVVVELLRSLKRRYSVLLVEHDMNAVFELADRISVLVYGRILVTGTPDEIKANEEVRAVYLGEEEVATS